MTTNDSNDDSKPATTSVEQVRELLARLKAAIEERAWENLGRMLPAQAWALDRLMSREELLSAAEGALANAQDVELTILGLDRAQLSPDGTGRVTWSTRLSWSDDQTWIEHHMPLQLDMRLKGPDWAITDLAVLHRDAPQAPADSGFATQPAAAGGSTASYFEGAAPSSFGGYFAAPSDLGSYFAAPSDLGSYFAHPYFIGMLGAGGYFAAPRYFGAGAPAAFGAPGVEPLAAGVGPTSPTDDEYVLIYMPVALPVRLLGRLWRPR